MAWLILCHEGRPPNMSTLLAPVEKLPQAPDEQRFLVHAVDWAAYRAISEALAGHHLHLAYDRGRLEFMTSSRSHGNYSFLLGRLVCVLAEEFHLPISSCGDMTCDREDLERGLELDQCFYLEHEPLIRHKEVLDLTIDPPPDLGIEIEITRSFIDRLGICEALGIAEVWRFNGQRIRAYHRRSDGRYVESDYSLHFPFLKVQEMVAFLQKRTEMDENRLVRLFRDWVQEQISQAGPTAQGTARERAKKPSARKEGTTKRKQK
jgi:Uma2 family endonuclease